MAGIAAFFARESVPQFEKIIRPMIDSYVTDSTFNFDGIIIDPKADTKTHAGLIQYDAQKLNSLGPDRYDTIKDFYQENMKTGRLFMFCVDMDISIGKQLVCFNHSSNRFSIGDQVLTSMHLIELYEDKCNMDMKSTLEETCSTDINMLAYDEQKKFLYSANDGHQGLQMCHAYVLGVGFMLHENMVCLRNIIHEFTDCSQDAVSLWETFYGHPLESEVIRETDLMSGKMNKIKFNPKYSY